MIEINTFENFPCKAIPCEISLCQKKNHFRIFKYCVTYYTLKFYAADIRCSPLDFANVYIIVSSTYLRPTVAWHSRYQRLSSRSERPTDHLKRIVITSNQSDRLNVIFLLQSIFICRF